MNQSIFPCLVLTVALWPTYRFLRRQVRQSGTPISLRIFLSCLWSRVKGFSEVYEGEVDVFLELYCFLYDPVNVGSLISGSSLKPLEHLEVLNSLLKPGLKAFEHNLASMWNECNCVVDWTLFGISLLWNWNKNGLFQTCGHCWVFQLCWHIECSILTASSFKIGNNSAGIPSPSLALFIAMLPKAHLTSYSRMSGSIWVTTPWWLSRTLRHFFCTVILCILGNSS